MTIKLVSDQVTPSLNRIQRELSALPNQALRVWIQNTPKLTGRARSQTSLVANKIIDANYDYADRLDQGYSSKRPQGMSKPTEQFLNQAIARIMRS